MNDISFHFRASHLPALPAARSRLLMISLPADWLREIPFVPSDPAGGYLQITTGILRDFGRRRRGRFVQNSSFCWRLFQPAMPLADMNLRRSKMKEISFMLRAGFSRADLFLYVLY